MKNPKLFLEIINFKSNKSSKLFDYRMFTKFKRFHSIDDKSAVVRFIKEEIYVKWWYYIGLKHRVNGPSKKVYDTKEFGKKSYKDEYYLYGHNYSYSIKNWEIERQVFILNKDYL